MTDLKTAAEVARELGRYARQGTVHRAHPPADLVMVIAQALTARDLAVAERVIEACKQAAQNWEVKKARMSRPMEPLKTKKVEGWIHESASEAIRALDPAKILEVEDESE